MPGEGNRIVTSFGRLLFVGHGACRANCARGTMQHVALRVKDDAELHAMRDRLRAKGVPVIGPKDHGFCKSIYFAGPENLSLELSFSTEPINAEAWIDPEVVALAGIDADELARYKCSSDFAEVVKVISIPRMASILSYSISGKIICSLTPML